MVKRISLTKNLFLDEYIPKELYSKYSSKILIGLIDSRLIIADQLLRNKFGFVTINNWWDGGERQWSGLRLPESPDYSLTSQHSYGRSSDKLFKNATAEEVRLYIISHYKELGITCIEKNVSWLHGDVRWVKDGNLLIV